MIPSPNALYSGPVFPGLRPFEAEDALLFFGREEQTDELLRRLHDTRFLAVVGLSGSGKSSLVRAGLLPAVHRGHLAGAGSSWRVCVMRPGTDPLDTLAHELNHTLGSRDDRGPTLRTGRLGLLDASRLGRKPEENLLIVVDQFEELFRFQETSRGRVEEAAEFVALLLAAAQEYEPAYRVYIVITLRADYLGDCARFRGLPEALNESQYLVPRMGREELREAIQGPAALGGGTIAPDLLEELLDRTGDDPDQLPVLQHLLMRMWEIRQQSTSGSRLTSKEYSAVGGWDGALNQHADFMADALPGIRQKVAKRMFQRLTGQGSQGSGVRRPTTIRELAAVAAVPSREIEAVVRHFGQGDCNFLTSPDHELTEDSIIDISQESLIRRWRRLNQWVEEEANWGEWYRRIEDRRMIRGAFLVDPELESALQASIRGAWNEAWAERYGTEKDGVRLPYSEAMRFLDASTRRRSDEVNRLRRTRRLVATAACVFAVLAVTAAYFAWSARQAKNLADISARQAQEAEGRAVEANRLMVISQKETEKARLEAQAKEAERLGLKKEAEQLQRSAEAAQKSLDEVRKAAATRQRNLDFERVANQYYVSPYSSGFSLWYSGSWYGRSGSVSMYSGAYPRR